ncbi:uncharacterized protein LOC118662162 [Myotis myotis]|uniref:uncharacterized protein LOC118662162 n=1 Tax=Myotis myotis TaxID=51298 RepID=UPI001749975E|nr:uncharacterized protein LOC118662162 [Myotis myotis]
MGPRWLGPNLRAECQRQSSSSLGRGVSPNTSSLPPGSRGGSASLSAAAAAAAAPGLSGGGLPAVQGSGDSERARPRGDPAEAAAGMEEASSGAEPPGNDFLPSSAPLQLGQACGERLRGGRGLRLGPGSGSRQASRAQRGNRRAVAALGNLRRLGRSLSLPSTRGANRKRAAGPSDGQASRPMSTADINQNRKKNSPDRSGRVRRRFPHPLPPPPPSLLTMCKAAGSPA